ncbi:MAG: phosphotransferase family protein, partial [Pseudonocardiaceae bacterium]
LPGRDELRAICAVAGLDDRDAVLLHVRSNAVYHLPREALVLRLARDTPPQVDRAHKVVAVCRWLVERHGPSLAPADIPQPVFASSTVATAWPALPSSCSPDATALGVALRDLHAITDSPPPLPSYRPLVRLREALALDAARVAPVLTADEHAWLADQADRLCAGYADLASRLGDGLIHGDAHTGNMMCEPTAGRWVLIDFDHAAYGPRELDLRFAAPDHFQTPAADRAAFTHAYGHDLLSWPGWRTLRDLTEVHSLSSYLRRAPTAPAAATELARRLHSLRTADPTIRWIPVS